MRRFRYSGGLGKSFDMVNTNRSRGGSWSRLAKQLKAITPYCKQCGNIVGLEADHIVPLHRGGTNAISNIQILCQQCHANKTSQDQSR